MTDRHDMRQFLLFVFVLLIPCFVVWTAAEDKLMLPAVGLVHLMLSGWFPDVVHALYVEGNQALLMTAFGESGGRPVPLSDAQYRLGFRVNPAAVSYSLPFYTALYFALPRQEYLMNYLLGLALLYGLSVIGLLCLCLKELVVNLGPLFLEQPGVLVPHANLIGLLFQFNVLIVPTLAPIMLWLWQSRESDLLRHALPVEKQAQ